MSHRYSDNLYSYPGLGNDEDIEGTAGPQQDQGHNQNASQHIYDFSSGPSYNSPFSPPELEEDPSIEPTMTGDSKAREAARLSGRDIPDEDIYNADERHGDTTHQHPPSQIDDAGYPALPMSRSAYATPSAHSQPQQAAYYPYIPSQAGNSSSSGPYIPRTSGSPYAAYPQHRQSTTSSHGSSSPFPFEAPPAYTPSPTSASPTSPLNSHAASSTSYQTFPQATTPSTSSSSNDSMGRPDESTGLLQGRGPESMGGNPGDGPENVRPKWTERVKSRLPSRETVKKTLLVLIVAVLLLGIVTDSRDLEWDDLDPYPPSRPDHGRGGGGGHNGDTSPSKPPAMQYPDLDNELDWFGRYHCGGGGGNHKRLTETHDVTFSSSKHLTINQERLERDGDSHHYDTYVQVQGEVILRRSGKDTPGPSTIVLDVIVNDDRIPIATDWNPNDQVFTIKTPDGLNTGERNRKLCATVKLTVWVPEDAELNYLQITTIHLGVQLLDNLSLTVNTLAKIDAVASNIISAFSGSASKGAVTLRKDKTPPSDTSPDSFAFHPRKCEAGTTSGQIYGVWPLHDSLTLKTTSGDIKVGIEPQENWDKDSQATTAELSIRSSSGDVDFREHGASSSSSKLPQRDYLVDVHTTSGNVHALAAFGLSATVKSTSGTLKLELLPVLKSSSDDDSHPVEVSTSSTSGTTYITVLDPLYFSSSTKSSPALRNIHNQHTSTSGDYHLSLPSVWEGEIVMTSLSGKLGVAGKDVKLIKSGEKWPGFNKELVARKGEVGGDKGEGSRVRVGLTSGSGEVKVGL
ncbi:hypothetical protein B0T20DRAFT_249612 [Sordaria brevicollis]|uniref:Adhesin domain-containing protein n=1 Tax=Sordaria brevicollis TaxID=83679 RepID=A0AAE0PC05_SORBR|nr:hypothetical protein B0T20DRAFT_249612 [Sordaria brevicollis]